MLARSSANVKAAKSLVWRKHLAPPLSRAKAARLEYEARCKQAGSG